MTKSKLLQCAEGLIVTAAGTIFIILSLQIRSNPVSVDGAVNLLVQAKFIPLLLSVLITILGGILAVSQLKGRNPSSSDGGLTPRALAVTGLTAAYLILVSFLGFMFPSAVYMGAMMFLLNKDKKPLHLLLLTALYAIIALLLIPGILNLQLL